jgi:hypothetical protein
MTTTQTQLAEAFKRLAAGLSWLEDQQPDGKERANGIRNRLADHLTHLADGMADKTRKCDQHPQALAHNCGLCRSERIGRTDYDEPADQPMPPVPDEVRELEARMLGEHE